jgi:ADP-ribosyl-[dinitrogen reductase] hydrolase
LAPVAMFYHPDAQSVATNSAESSRTTHGAAECLDACRLLGTMISRALAGRGTDDVLFSEARTLSGSITIEAIARGDYRRKPEDDIRGTWYAVESLESALWCFFQTDTFDSAILRAANLGDDADTTAAVCGQLAGAFYGARGIRHEWLQRLVMRRETAGLAERLHSTSANG